MAAGTSSPAHPRATALPVASERRYTIHPMARSGSTVRTANDKVRRHINRFRK
jgi:hypothetical protein